MLLLLHFTTNLRCKTTYQIHTHTHSLNSALGKTSWRRKTKPKKKIKNQKILELPQIQCRDGKTTRRASKTFRSFVKRSSSSSSTSRVERKTTAEETSKKIPRSETLTKYRRCYYHKCIGPRDCCNPRRS